MFRFLKHPNRRPRTGDDQGPEGAPRATQFDNHGLQRHAPGAAQQPARVGAGGYGPRGARWPGETVPAGGEGYMNAGLTVPPLGGAIYTGGMPWQQVTTVGATAHVHRIVSGETMASVAATYYGPQGGVRGLMSANPTAQYGGPVGPNMPITPGANIVVPPASGPGYSPPGGVAGNGVGGGSIQVNQNHGTRARALHQSISTSRVSVIGSPMSSSIPGVGGSRGVGHGGGHR